MRGWRARVSCRRLDPERPLPIMKTNMCHLYAIPSGRDERRDGTAPRRVASGLRWWTTAGSTWQRVMLVVQHL
jgi:hypothetical protein